MSPNLADLTDTRLRAVVDRMLDPFYLLDSVRDAAGRIVDFKFVYVNYRAEEQTEQSRADLIGGLLSQLFPIFNDSEIFDQIARVVETGETLEQERLITYRENESGWFFQQFVPIGDGIAIINRNVSHRKALEARVLEQERALAQSKEDALDHLKFEMMQRIAHEFRTPLARIGLASDIMERYFDRLTHAQLGERVHDIKTEIVRLEGMLSALNAAVIGLEPPEAHFADAVDICVLSHDIAARFRRIHSQPNRLNLTCASIPHIRSSAHLLDLILVNLIANAIKFSGTDTPICVDISLLDGEKIVLFIKDSGIGILPDDLPHVTEPFYRGRNFDEMPGLGVGLTLVNHAVKALNGQLEIISSPAQGTHVRVIIPAVWESES